METIDTKNICEKKLNELALFAGAGGGIWGSRLIGLRTVCAVELNRYAASVLVARQNDGSMEPFPIWDDVCTFDGRQWQGIVDVISGGFPCQDISSMGGGQGISDGEKSGLWREFARIVDDVRPSYVFVENSPNLTFRGLDIVLADLCRMGFHARWGVFSACSVGAPHMRKRMFILAYARARRRKIVEERKGRTSTNSRGLATRYGRLHKIHRVENWLRSGDGFESALCRKSDGVADFSNRIAALGNGQVPAVVKLAWDTLTDGVI